MYCHIKVYKTLCSDFEAFMAILVSLLRYTYDTKWMIASLNTQWKRLINPRSLRNRSNTLSTSNVGTWYLDHKGIFSDRQWVGTRIGSEYLSLYILSFHCIP